MRHGKALFSFCALLVFFVPWGFAGGIGPRPALPAGSRLLEKSTLSISHNSFHKQADWVFYGLGPEQLQNCVKRSNRFKPDPELSSEESSQLEDYSRSGFDRGHLSPAADNKFSESAMREAFYLSNISPQPPRFNQGIWSRLENMVRAWALESEGLWVATGPVLSQGLQHIGPSRVSTAEYFYKVILTKAARGKQKAIAFLMPVDAEGTLQPYAVAINQVERISGLNFNANLSGKEQADLETKLELSSWDFGARYSPLPCGRERMELSQFLQPPLWVHLGL